MFPISFSRFFRQWRAYDIHVSKLSRLGDSELAVLGATRGDIARLAWQRAERTA